jgi:hypothetical protein
MIMHNMTRLSILKQAEPLRYGTRPLASAMGISRVAFGSVLAAKYLTSSVRADGPGHPRCFTIVDAWQFVIFFQLYEHWSRSIVALGWLVDALLDQDKIEFGTWVQARGTPTERPSALSTRENVIDRIERLDRDPSLLPAWYRHRDLSQPFHILVTSATLEVTQSPDIRAKDGVVVNMTRAITEFEYALTAGRRAGSRLRKSGAAPRQC